MIKKRVHELARELNIESKDIIRVMSHMGVELKSHMSTMEDGEIDLFMKDYNRKKDQGAAEADREAQKTPVNRPAPGPSAIHENQVPREQDRPRQETAQDNRMNGRKMPEKRRPPDRKDFRPDRSPGLVDRVPSRPPDRRFDDRTARPAPPRQTGPMAPAPSQRPEARQQPAPPVPAGSSTQPSAQSSTERAGRDTNVSRPAAPVPQQPYKERPQYPDRQRPAAQDQHRDHRPPFNRPAGEARPAGDRGFQQRGPAPAGGGYDRPRPAGDRGFQQRGPSPAGGGFDRPRPDGTRPPRFGDNARPGGGAPPGRPFQNRGPAGPRPAPTGGAPGGRPSPGGLKVPKVPDQAKGVDKIKASEKSRTRLQQTQAKGGFGKRDKVRHDEDDRGGRLKRKGPQKGRADLRPTPPLEKKPVVIGETVTVQELAEKMKKSPAELIKKLMVLGILATINQEIDSDTAIIIAGDFGFEVEIKIHLDAEAQMEQNLEDKAEDMIIRPCVVTIMGHVDHGKTSLLDAIRETNVIATEAGGITQHIGAYQVEHNNKKITFVDTPGHEAFTAMRARGSQVTDIVVLVVAAEDGVMPQTIEAINHAKAAEVPIIVAINKMDKPDANADRVKQQLTEYGLVSEEWGGDTICVPVSAKARIGIEDLLENILLVGEVNELRANPNRPARGTVIEAELDKGRGPLATVLVQNGTLHIGDGIVAGTAFGKVRAMVDDKGRRIKKAGPSTPVEVLGFHDVPLAGDAFYVVKDEKAVRQIIDKRVTRRRQEELKTPALRVTLEDLFKHIQEGQVKELCLIVKADVQGSVEAINQSLVRLSTEEVKVNIVHGGVGAIRESDIMLASASNAIIIGFNVRPDVNARKAAENEKVDIRLYRVIYDAIDDIKAAMSGLLDPELREVILGRVEVRKVFKASKLGNIAGCYVTEGKISRDAGIRLIRDGIVVFEGKVDSLKRFKDDAKEVLQGYECGLTLENYQDIREGDTIEAFTTEQIKRELA
ncbi:MAG: translation initiation factor IF-2 [Peptococcaceae bacterium BRH_c4a]|nr:MAG: translation initiation factor IF-2 [Peptococcaceae bacterium BRH_c4a]